SADQAGSASYAAGEQGTASVQVDKAAQAITFGALADRVATDAAFSLSATGGDSSSPGTVASSSAACPVRGSSVAAVTRGRRAATRAGRAADGNEGGAEPVTQAFNVTLAAQSITAPAVPSFVWKDGSATLAATASSGLAITYSVLSGPCTVSGSTLTATAGGT